MRAWVDVAILAKTKNLQGGFVAHSVANLPFLLFAGLEVAFVPPVLDAPRTARLTSVTPAANRAAVVTFDAVQDIEVAEALVGCHCLVRRADVPEGAFDVPSHPWAGWEVYDTRAGLVGTVAGVREMPGQDVLEVVSNTQTHPVLIPLVEAFVVKVNQNARRIDIDAPNGLLEL